MAKQVINVGAAANDGTGDPLRTAMQKVNLNFTELYDADDAAFGGSYDDLTDKPDIPSDLTDLGITDGNAANFFQPMDQETFHSQTLVAAAVQYIQTQT